MAKQPSNIITVDDIDYTILSVDVSEGKINPLSMSVEMFVQKVSNGDICRDVLIQRTENQWTRKKSSELIVSILKGRPIGQLLVTGERMYGQMYEKCSLLDGLQRTTAITHFVNNKYALNKTTKPLICRCKSEDGLEITHEIVIAGKKFKQLPPALQRIILNYNITMYEYVGYTDEELDEIVFNVNNGTSFKPNQKLRVAYGTRVMKHIQPIYENSLWLDIQNCNEKNDTILGCITRSLMLITDFNFKSFGAADTAKFVDELNTECAIKQIQYIKELYDKFELVMMNNRLSDEDREFFNSCNVPHIIANLDTFGALDGYSIDDYVDFLISFVRSEDNINKYNEYAAVKAASGGSQYSSENVRGRQMVIDNAMANYFAIKQNMIA